MKMRLIVPAGLVLAATVAVLLATRPGDAAVERWDALKAVRGDAVALLRETGTLAPRDPLIVAAPFDGKLQWIIEDATWVQQGEPLFIISDDDELKKVADERRQLEEAVQDRELAALKLAQAIETEARKVRKAQDDLTLEQARHRILTEPAKGGEELVRLDRELRPMTEGTAAVRARFEAVRDAWQRAQDAYLDRLDGWQQHQDALLRQENRLDELAAAVREAANRPADAMRKQKREGRPAGDKPGKPDPAKAEPDRKEPPKPAADPEKERAEILAERERLRGLTEGLRTGLDAARAARDAATGPRDEAASALAEKEEAERDLRIRIEIEKRRLPATQLELDLRLAEVSDAEAVRRLAEGRASLEAKVISRAAYDDLVAVAEQARSQLTTTRERLAIAAKPAGEEVLAEARARLAKAVQSAAQAAAVRERNLEIQRQEGAVLDARITRLGASLAVRARRFPSTIEQEIAARERSSSLHPEDAARLADEIAGLKRDLEKARGAPPNVLVAPAAGLVKVRREGDRQKLAGDQAWQADPMCEVYPPQNMEVVVRVNEVNVPRLKQGMRVSAEIPALGRLPRTGVISQVAGVGRDKNELLGRKGQAGVTQYEARVVLDPGTDGRDGDFRQGMTALVAIELERVSGALCLPRAAVERGGDGWAVHRTPGGPPVPITGRPVGDDAFVIESGLQEGDQVHVRRITSR